MKQPLEIKVNPETPAYVAWLAAVREICRAYMAEHYPTLPDEILDPQVGSRYIKIVRRSAKVDPATGRPNHSSAWAFIDRTNGDVLKAASWAAPAKGMRGNIFDDKAGLGSMSNSGPAYLR